MSREPGSRPSTSRCRSPAIRSPRLRYRLRRARSLAAAGDLDAATAVYRKVLRRAPGHAEWHAELARMERKAGNLDAADEAFRAALALEPRRAEWHYGHGRVLERLHQPAAARQAYEAGLGFDPKADARAAELLARDAWHFPPRLRLLKFVGQHLDEIRERAQPDERPLTDPKVFVYWSQGIESAPTVVQRCQEELHRLHPGGEVVLLDESVWDELDIPARTRERTRARLTHASDRLRLELLYRHGGIWLDATCLPRRALPDVARELAGGGFFAFERGQYRLANWFLISAPGNYVIATMRAALDVYWQHFDRLIDYYIFHHLFEALCVLDEPFRTRWQASPRLDAGPPHAFRRRMFDDYDPAKYRALLDASFVAKLSYKRGDRITPDSMMARFLEHGVAAERPL